jgi:UDP-glucose 6-dehydrogenase
MHVAMIGSGYVGLVSGACLADFGHSVVCVDKDAEKISALKGTGDEVARIIHEARPDADIAVVSNPEFLREGAAIQDFKHPDRIVVGSDDERAR